jgi:SNF2 family DNA or RNA helicase
MTLGDIFMPIRRPQQQHPAMTEIPVVDLTEDMSLAMKRSGSFDNMDFTKKIKLDTSDTGIPYFNPEQEELQVEKLFNSLKSVKVLREMEGPKTLLVSLRSYQKQALGWMVDRENLEAESKAPIPYPWEQYTTNDGKKYYFNRETKQAAWELPVHFTADKADLTVKGGILADEMGMVRTIMSN